MATPFAAQAGLPVLLAARACMGIGEGVAMPAMNNLLARCAGAVARINPGVQHDWRSDSARAGCVTGCAGPHIFGEGPV